MPQVVTPDKVPERTRQSTYDFEQYANGDWTRWEQGKGKDFEGKADSFIGTARAYGKRHGYTLETRKADNGATVYLRFVKA